MWTSEINRLLEAQLVLMKGMQIRQTCRFGHNYIFFSEIVIKSGTLDRKKYKGKAKLGMFNFS